MRRSFGFLASATLLVAATLQAPSAYGVEISINSYSPLEQATGTLVSIGSDTMAYLVAQWVVSFKDFHPGLRSRILQAGSATAPPALLNGSATIGPMSRKMKDSEIQAFVKKFGYPPTEFRVAMDALAVYVHKDNPVEGLTLPQLDAIFSSTHNCGVAKEINSWAELNTKEAMQNQQIEIYGRNTLSGTYAFFAEHALCNGKFRNTVQIQATSKDVVQLVAASRVGIGYSGIGYLTGDVRAVPLASASGHAFVPATSANVYNGTYPLSRYLYIYINKAPNQPMASKEREFMRMVLSADGQSLIAKSGFIPLSAEALRQEQMKLR